MSGFCCCCFFGCRLQSILARVNLKLMYMDISSEFYVSLFVTDDVIIPITILMVKKNLITTGCKSLASLSSSFKIDVFLKASERCSHRNMFYMAFLHRLNIDSGSLASVQSIQSEIADGVNISRADVTFFLLSLSTVER